MFLGPYVTALSSYCRINSGVTAGGLGSFLVGCQEGRDQALKHLGGNLCIN